MVNYYEDEKRGNELIRMKAYVIINDEKYW